MRRNTAVNVKTITLSGSAALKGEASGTDIDNLRMKDGVDGTGTKERVPAIEPVQKGDGIEPVIRIDGDEPEKLQPAAVKKAVGVDDIVNYFRASVKAIVRESIPDKPFITVLKDLEPVLLIYLDDINVMEEVGTDTIREVDVVDDQKATTGIVIGTDIGIGAKAKIVVAASDHTTNGNHIDFEPVEAYVMLDVPVTDVERVSFPVTNEKDDVNRVVVEPTIKEDGLSLKGLVTIFKLRDEPP